MATSTQEWIDELKSISVLELSERIKALEEEFGVSATAVRRGRPGRRGGGGDAAERGGADGVRRHPHRRRRQEDPGHQGRPRGDRPRPQGGQGARRRGPQARQGGRRQRRGRQAQGRASKRPAPPSRSSKRFALRSPRGATCPAIARRRCGRRTSGAIVTARERTEGRPIGAPFVELGAVVPVGDTRQGAIDQGALCTFPLGTPSYDCVPGMRPRLGTGRKR